MQKSILDAIREGSWDFEPDEVPTANYDATAAIPGSAEKLAILASRAQRGLPLWHDSDRRDYDYPLEDNDLDKSDGHGSPFRGAANPRD